MKNRRTNAGFGDVWISVNILLSAGLYLFDFGTNIHTAVAYYHVRSSLPQIFPAMVGFLVAAHVGNAAIFWSTLSREDQPSIMKACFLPMIQLWRLGKLLWFRCTCQGLRSLESDVKPLYNILAVALDSGPQLLLQLVIFIGNIDKSEINGLSATGLRLSMMASQLSASYNGAVAVMTLANKDTTGCRLGIAIAGGIYIFAAMLLRSSSVVIILITTPYFYRVFLPFVGLGMVVIFIPAWYISRKNSLEPLRTRLLRCASYSYAGLSIGPLYPMLNEYQRIEREDLGKLEDKVNFRRQIWIASISHLLLDVMILPYAIVHYQFRPPGDVRNIIYPEISNVGSLFSSSRAQELQATISNLYTPRFFYGVVLYLSSILIFTWVDGLSDILYVDQAWREVKERAYFILFWRFQMDECDFP